MSPDTAPADSARRAELLELAYAYVLEHGLTGLSLRPLAAAIGSSPRVLLFLFGSKDGLVQALLARAREEELAFLGDVRDDHGLAGVGATLWRWLADDRRRPLLRLWAEAYARSLTEPGGAWDGFARETVDAWLALLANAQPAASRDAAETVAERTLLLAVLRGALLDLLATGDAGRTTAAVERHLAALEPS